MRFAVLFTLCVAAALVGHAQPRVVSGPMLAWQEHREVAVWVESAGGAAELRVRRDGEDGPVRVVAPARVTENPVGTQVNLFVVDGLEMGAAYTYDVAVGGVAQAFPYPTAFRAKDQWEWRRDPPDVHFLAGSCFYNNDAPYDRPGRPYGQSTEIYGAMARSGAHFLVWLGDNLYLREADWSSRYGIWYRYSRDRATPEWQEMLARMHHYGVWDDHEYGPNDSTRAYELKDETLAAFRAYFPARSGGEADNPGIYTRFKQGDAEFFLLDGRYHRDHAALDEAAFPGKALLGRRQLEWLFSALRESQADRNVSVRFIALGSQVLNPFALFENYAQYAGERAALLEFLAVNRIDAVVFLTGDRHFTELSRLERADGPALLDLTASSVTAGPNRRAITEGADWAEAVNPVRVEGTLIPDNNFCSVRITGPRQARVLTFAGFDRAGARLWERTVPVADLRWPRAAQR